MCVDHVICGAEIDLNSRECPPDVLPLHQVGGTHLAHGLCRRILWGETETLSYLSYEQETAIQESELVGLG